MNLKWLLLAVCLGGCARAPRARYAESQPLLNRLFEQTSCSRAVLGDAKLRLSGPFVDVQENLLYRAQAPQSVRFDVYSSLGVTLSTLTMNSDEFALYDLPEKSFYYGPAAACNLERFTRVRMPPFALVELLRGRPPLLAHESEGTTVSFVRPPFSRGRYVLKVEGDHGSREKLEFLVAPEDFDKPLAAQRLRLWSVRVEQQGHLLYEVELSDYRVAERAPRTLTEEERELGLSAPPPTGPACQAELPGKLSFSVGRGGFRLTIENEEVFHNPPQAPGAYTQEAPGGTRAIHSNCD